MMDTFKITPSEQLDNYNGFIIRSKKNDILGIKIQNYSDALLIFQSFIKTLEIKNDVTLEGFSDSDKCYHTIFYTYRDKAEPFTYFLFK